jgi:hypothetical protein
VLAQQLKVFGCNEAGDRFTLGLKAKTERPWRSVDTR